MQNLWDADEDDREAYGYFHYKHISETLAKCLYNLMLVIMPNASNARMHLMLS